MSFKPKIYQINNNEVPLFMIGYIANILGFTVDAIHKKEDRHMIPPARFRSPTGKQLYSVEELAMFDYLFKEIWTKKRGARVPAWVKALAIEVLLKTQDEVVQYGKVRSPDVYKDIQKKYPKKFSRWKAWLYIEHYRYMLLDNDDDTCPEFEEDEEE